jgi:hypothetical protein
MISGYPQHPDFFAAGDADAQPHPDPPVPFASASRAQHASVPAGAGPPQHALAAPSTAVSSALFDVF